MEYDSELIDRIEGPLRTLIETTGAFVKTEFLDFSFSSVEYKGKNNPFTYVDVQAENRLKSGCSDLIPGSGFVNEESDNQASENGYVWIIDPIDGTTNFTHGLPHFSISLALEYEGELLLGYVYHVMADEMFSAIKGRGAKLNDRKIQVSQRQQISESLLATGFPYGDIEGLENFLGLLFHMIQKGQGLRRIGSAALDLAYVAAGRIDLYFEIGLSPWDVAAGILIVEEAGGKVSDYMGQSNHVEGKRLIASNGHVHEEMLEIVKQHT